MNQMKIIKRKKQFFNIDFSRLAFNNRFQEKPTLGAFQLFMFDSFFFFYSVLLIFLFCCSNLFPCLLIFFFCVFLSPFHIVLHFPIFFFCLLTFLSSWEPQKPFCDETYRCVTSETVCVSSDCVCKQGFQESKNATDLCLGKFLFKDERQAHKNTRTRESSRNFWVPQFSDFFFLNLFLDIDECYVGSWEYQNSTNTLAPCKTKDQCINTYGSFYCCGDGFQATTTKYQKTPICEGN